MDETKKALLSIDIDTAALTQNVTNAKTAVAALTDQLKELKAAGKESSEAFTKISDDLKKAGDAADKSAKAIKDFSNNVTKGAKSAASQQGSVDDAMLKTLRTIATLDKMYGSTPGTKQYRLEIKSLKNEYDNLTIAEQNNKAIGGQLEKRITILQAAQKNMTVEQFNNTKAVQHGTDILLKHQKIIDASAVSTTNSQYAIKVLNREYLNLSESQRKNADVGGVLKKQIEILQKNVDTIGRSVPQFADKVIDASSKMLPFGKSIADAGEKFKSLHEGLKNIKDSMADYRKEVQEVLNNSTTYNSTNSQLTKGLERLKANLTVASGGFDNLTKAIAGTGIGLLIVAVAALFEYFKKFEPVMELLDRGMAMLNGTFDFLNRTVWDFITNIKSLGDLFSKLYNMIRHPLDAMKSFGNSMLDAATSAGKLKAAQQELDKSMQASGALSAEKAAKVADLLAQAHKKGISADERKRLMKEVADLENTDLARRKSLADQQLDIALKSAGKLHSLTEAEIKDIKKRGAAAVLELQENKKLTKEEVDLVDSAIKKEAELNQEASAKTQKRYENDEAKARAHSEKMQEIRNAAQRAKNEKEQSAQRVALANIEDANEREKKQIEIEFKNREKEFTKYDDTVKQLEIEKNQKIDQITKNQKAAYDQEQEKQLKDAEGNIEKTHELRLKQIENDLKFELSYLSLSEDQKKAVRKKYEEQKAKADEEFATANLAKRIALEKKLAEDTKKAKKETDPEKKKQAEIKVIEDQYSLEVFLAAGNKEQLLKIEEKHAAALKKLEEEKEVVTKKRAKQEQQLNEETLKYYQGHFAKLAGMFNKNTQVGKAAFMAQKALAVAEIAINTQKQVSSTISATRTAVEGDMDFGPIIGPIKAAIDIAIGAAEVVGIIANGVKQTATLNSINPAGFARGGLYLSDGYGTYVTGPGTGTSDSINAKLSHGEAVINARSTEMFAPILSAINQAGGGRAFNTSNTGNGYALGGLFNGSNTLNDGSSDLANTRALNDMAKTLAANMPRQILVVEDVQAGLQNKAMLQSMSNF